MSAETLFYPLFQLVKSTHSSFLECFILYPAVLDMTCPIPLPSFSIKINGESIFPFLRHGGPNQLPNQVKAKHLRCMNGRVAFSGDFYKLIKSGHR